ncbi:hypothetical protein ONZ45_g9903 [Pleurotus djamor]|nr:hypothetical protein ONZ45_g9903 [Pleurotus djamor]
MWGKFSHISSGPQYLSNTKDRVDEGGETGGGGGEEERDNVQSPMGKRRPSPSGALKSGLPEIANPPSPLQIPQLLLLWYASIDLSHLLLSSPLLSSSSSLSRSFSLSHTLALDDDNNNADISDPIIKTPHSTSKLLCDISGDLVFVHTKLSRSVHNTVTPSGVHQDI